jgi:hypothetical protein
VDLQIAAQSANHRLKTFEVDHLVPVVGHARTHADTRLVRWWGETRATEVYALASIHPDGHGIWALAGTGERRLRRHELPSDHGLDGVSNPHRFSR